MIERGKGVYVWNSKGRRLFDAYAGLAVVNVGHGRAEIADAVREQVAKLAYYPTTRQFSNPPAARLAARLAELTPGDLKYTLFAVSGSEATALHADRARLLAQVGRPRKYKASRLPRLSRRDARTLAICGQPDLGRRYEPFAPWRASARCRCRTRVGPGAGTTRIGAALRRRPPGETIQEEDPETVAAGSWNLLSSGSCIIRRSGWLERVRDIWTSVSLLISAGRSHHRFGRTGSVRRGSLERLPDLMWSPRAFRGYTRCPPHCTGELADSFPEKPLGKVHQHLPGAIGACAARSPTSDPRARKLVQELEVMGAMCTPRSTRAWRGLTVVGEVRRAG